MKQKYYAVLVGKKTGIFNTWEECKKNVSGFSGTIYKSFDNLLDAQNYLKLKPNNTSISNSIDDNNSINKDIEDSLNSGYTIAFVDGSYDHRIKRFGYGTYIFNKIVKQQFYKSFNTKEFLESRNVSGEIFGVLATLQWCINNQIDKIKIYYDYEGIERWFDGSWKAKTNIALFYVNELNKLKSNFKSISFKKVLAHSGIEYNEIADKLAKKSLNNY